MTSSLPQDMKNASNQKAEGDRYILARFHLIYGTIVEDSNNSLEDLLGQIPNFLHSEESENLSVCEVEEWRIDKNDSSNLIPTKLETLFTILHYADPIEDR